MNELITRLFTIVNNVLTILGFLIILGVSGTYGNMYVTIGVLIVYIMFIGIISLMISNHQTLVRIEKLLEQNFSGTKEIDFKGKKIKVPAGYK
tara:strand:+ start:328 stop:606 length:279 start_codon:yes stop_codon:yes gene_type:complete